MGKFVFWVGVAALIWLAFKLFQVLKRKGEQQRARLTGADDGEDSGGPGADARTQAHGPAPTDTPVAMIRCRHCGLYLPGNEAVRQGDSSYCSIEHRDAGPSGLGGGT
jgi:hypothetical protein